MRLVPLLVVSLWAWMGIADAQTAGPTTEGLGSHPFEPAGAGQTGQPNEGRRAWGIVPRVAVQEIVTDNVALASVGRKSDQITEISPGVKVEANTARLRMYLDYGLRGQYYAQNSAGSRTQNTLNAFGTFEAIEKTLFVDLSGIVARQSISAFGPQSTGAYSVNSNSTETSNFRISPFLRGRLGTFASYEARYAHSWMRAKSTAVSDTDVDEWTGRLIGNTPLSALGWSLDASAQQFDYSLGRKTESDRVRGFLTYRVHPQLKFSVSAGRESNDFTSLTKRTWNTDGYGFDWLPTERTQVSAFSEKRFFGNGHQVNATHRFPLSAISYRDSRDISALPNQLTTVGLGNVYDLLFAQLASSIPDPTARATYVNSLLNAAGIAPNVPVVASFLSSQVTVQRRQELSWVVRGARNVLTLAMVRSQNEFLGSALLPQNSATSSVSQKGFNAAWSHQMSAATSLNLSGSHMRSLGTGTVAGQSQRQKSLSVMVTTKLGPKTSASLTARRTEAEGTAAPYSENALIGSLVVQF